MAHLPPSAAIFSPSVARQAATTAKDWNYIDSWLSAKFHGRTPPPFERNPDTLKALLALAALNETADDDRDLLARLDATTINPPSSSSSPPPGDSLPTTILDALEDHLPPPALTALTALATAATALNQPHATPPGLGAAMLELQARVFAAAHAAARVAVLERHVGDELAHARALLAEVRGEGYAPGEGLARQNLDAQRRLKAAAGGGKAVVDAPGRAAALAAVVGGPEVTVEGVRRVEEGYLALLSRKDDLENQVKAFHGLPPDKEQARHELESLRTELRSVTQRRDAVFENLVERDTPRRVR